MQAIALSHLGKCMRPDHIIYWYSVISFCKSLTNEMWRSLKSYDDTRFIEQQ
jgi:hypothetical protein